MTDSETDVAILLLGGDEPHTTIDAETGAVMIEQDDGGVVVQLEPNGAESSDPEDFYANLADQIDESERQRIVEELLQGIDADDKSREEWLKTRTQGIDMLGFKLDDPRSDLGAAPLEGMSTVRHTLLPEACIRFQANASAELMPADGPVKVRNYQSPKPPGATDAPASAASGHNGGPDLDGDSNEGEGWQAILAALNAAKQPVAPPAPLYTDDLLAEALERGFNRYLTVVDKGYRADTVRMLFGVGFGGCGFKKVYNCPIKRRPISRSVDAKDLIVSNDVCDLEDAGRVTHRVRMRQSLMRRMQIVGAYRDVELGTPIPDYNETDRKTSEVQGFDIEPQRPEDYPFVIDECYCELDVVGFEHMDDGEPSGVPLPYKVSIERSSRKLLELRRNWREGDDTYMARRNFVKYEFVPALGFYSIGLLHILGNANRALTAAWREMLDSGMFASFPGFLYSKQAGRSTNQNNEMRIPPGGGLAIDTGNMPIQNAIMPLPYKEPGPAMLGLIQRIEEMGQRIGGTAEMPAGEGKQDAPVGTTLALIEQATKVIAAVHIGLHAAQSEEFQLLKERFLEDPESFWRFDKRPSFQWEVELFKQAINDCDLVPAADPNTASHMHRIMKAIAVKQLQAMNPQLYDAKAVDLRIFDMIGISDPEQLFNQAPPQPGAAPGVPLDPNKMAELQMKKERADSDHQARIAELALKIQQHQRDAADRTAQTQQSGESAERDRQIQAQMAAVHSADAAAERASRERIAQLRNAMDLYRLQADMRTLQVQLQTERDQAQTSHQADMEKLREQLKGDHHIADLEAKTRRQIAKKTD